ncbi:MAG TPA: hypothetical protein VMT87_07140 [Vicinamibacteria bacterium]|nr:hypothetical protein [Vicinamibacteria bacterium]
MAHDIRDLRQITGTKYAEGIKLLLEYYRENFTPSMDKAPRK